MAEEHAFDISGFVFPLVCGRPDDDIFRIDRFIGSGFWIDSHGHFLTCKHVLDEVGEGECPAIGQPFGDERDGYIPVTGSTAHSEFDLALGRTMVKNSRFLDAYDGPLAPGLDIAAFGFMEWGKSGDSLELDVRYLKGHVTRISEDATGLPTPYIVETSFSSPSGFSGAPLLSGSKVVGMLFGNVETKLQGYSLTEVQDGDKEFRETAYRIHEYGLAHRTSDLVRFLDACAIIPFQ